MEWQSLEQIDLTRRRRLSILAICCSSLFIIGLDVTALNVALPSLGHELGSGISGLQWTIDAYTVVMASLLMFSGSIADRLGRKRVFLTGLTVFSIGSLLCGLAWSIEALVAFRVLQAVGASMLNPVAMSIITNTFTDPRQRAQAVGVWGAVFGISMAVGPILGGALTTWIDWRAIFFINIPVGLIAIALTLWFIPESKSPLPRRFDPIGQLLMVAMLASLTFGIIEAPGHGWTSPLILGAFTTAVAALIGLITYEPRRRDPLIDLRFFRSIPFSSAIAISVSALTAFGGFLFLNTLYLQEARGYSALQAGLATTPMALMIVVTSPISGRIVGRRGPRGPLVLAGVCFIAGSAMLTSIGPDTSLAYLLVSYVIMGLAFGSVNAPITNAAVSGMPRAQAGVASAVASTSRLVGHTLGVAIVGAIVASSLSGAPGATLSTASHAAWWVLAACGAVVLALGFVGTSVRAKASAQVTAAELNPEALAA
ncbi:MAG: DHA2 family efflux MFS transporter permease subunit [Solirubrobacterales bacterium]